MLPITGNDNPWTRESMFQNLRQQTGIWWWASWLVLVLSAFLWALRSPTMVPLQPLWAFGLITWVVGLLIAASFGLLAVLGKAVLEQIPNFFVWALAASIPIFIYTYDPLRSSNATCFLWLLLVGQATLLGLCWSELRRMPWQNRQIWGKIIMGLAGGLSIIGITLTIAWMSTSVFNPPTAYHWNISEIVPTIDLPDPSLEGPYPVKTLFYGSGKDLRRQEYGPDVAIKTASVDGSGFISGWDGFWGNLRTKYWGFDSEKLPLNGRVWFPEGTGPFPLVLIIHGNHDMEEYSDPGYEYLGRLFASRGFIAFSVDENFLNGSWTSYWDSVSTNPARSWLLLEHLSLWRKWNGEKGNPFFGKVDMARIALIGHSRGGEAVATAVAFNKLPYYPDDATVRFDYNFNILAVAAVAPVDKQYTPASKPVRLNNINYFVLQGAHDGDVRTFYGSAEFHRITFSGDDYWFKAAAYVARANHGRFNSSWEWLDIEAPSADWMKSVDLLPRPTQQKLAQVYLSAFLEVVLNKQAGYLPLFEDYRTGRHWLPETKYISLFEDSKDRYILTLENGLDVTEDAKSGARMSAENVSVWRHQQVDLRHGKQDISAVYLGWDRVANKKTASYTIDLPSSTLINPEDELIFLAANSHEEPTLSSEICHCPLDFTIELEDKAGHKADLPLSHVSSLAAPIYARLMKASFMETDTSPEVVFQRFAIPLKDFVAQNPDLQPASIAKIRFLFNRSDAGVVALTHVGFRKG